MGCQDLFKMLLSLSATTRSPSQPIAEARKFLGPGLAASHPAVKRDEIDLLRVRIVLEFLEQFLRDFALPLGLLVVVRWVHYSDNSKAPPPTLRRPP